MAHRSYVSFVLGLVSIFGQFLFLYGLLGWAYGVLFQMVYPQYLDLGLSHLIRWIRVDTFAILSFIVSALGFLMWRLAREFKGSTDKSPA